MGTFSRLDIQAAAFNDEYTAKALIFPLVPPSFSGVIEARDSLTSIIALMHAVLDPHNNKYKPLPLAPLPDSIISQVQQLSALLINWSTVFDAFVTNPPTLSERDLTASTQLQIYHQSATIFLATFHNFFQCSYDQYLPHFKQIVSSCTTILAYHQNSRSHGGLRVAFDIGVIQPLHFVTLKCRDRKLRRQAIAVVEKAGREGVWDGESIAGVLRWAVAEEEKNLPPFEEDGGVGMPAEKDRLHQVGVEFYRLEKRVTVTGLRRVNGDDWDNWDCVVGELDCWGPPSREKGWEVSRAVFE